MMLSWLSPVLLWGTLLGAIPLVIHLLNRRRFRRVDWAPMKYLDLTIRRNRKRIELEQLLLLLLRIALPILLFLLLARPVLDATGLEGWLGGGRTSQVVLVDDSLSMAHAAGGPSAFARARNVAASLLEAARPQDRCTLLTTSQPSTPIVLEVEGSAQEALAEAANSLKPTGTFASWPTVLAAADTVLESCTYPTRQLTIVTDLRQAGWAEGDLASLARRWSEKRLTVRVIDVGSDEVDNTSIESITPLDRTILAGATGRWRAVVRNRSTRTAAGMKATLRVDDQPTEVHLPEIGPQQTVEVPLAVQFPEAGPHSVALELPDDALPGDNRRVAAIDVKDSLLIRLVDGEPSADPFGGEVDYLAAPLAIGVGDADAWRVDVAEEEDFLNPRLEPADVLVLANVATPTDEQAQGLAERVNAGMGLILFPGGRIDTGLYNERLDREGRRLLPFPFDAMYDEASRGIVFEPVRPSPLERMLDLKPSALERVAVRQRLGVMERPDPTGLTRVLARWNDPSRSAAIIERRVGQGTVLLWTTTADRAGTDWPVEPSFVLAVRDAVRGVARPTSLSHTLTTGEPLSRTIASDQPVRGLQLVPPSGEPQAVALEPLPDDPNRGPASAVRVTDTRAPGLYRLAWEDVGLGPQSDLFAFNPDPRESDLTRLPPGELSRRLAPLDVAMIDGRGGDSGQFAPTGSEFWRPMAWTLLGLLLVESVFATWVGRSR
jgi:hypothetical protein